MAKDKTVDPVWALTKPLTLMPVIRDDLRKCETALLPFTAQDEYAYLSALNTEVMAALSRYETAIERERDRLLW